MIDDKKIIAIFDINSIKKSDEFSNFYDKIKNNITDISNGNQRSLILIKDKCTKGYITNISSVTLRKR